MYHRISLLIPLLLIVLAVSGGSIVSKEAPETLRLSICKLENGLTVYLNEDRSASSVTGAVVVKGGSRRDPEGATGIAHYFEHIMFKGTDQIGTIDYISEKVYLDSIEAQYDLLGETNDAVKRQSIQLKINELSLKAAEYAIPNEFSKIISEMGGSGLNAFTAKDGIAYYNQFPANQMEKWLEVYSERFRHPVFRLFQAELEIVYEEKNRLSDNFMSLFYEESDAEIFAGTPYAQPVIGTTEHLKNPSLTKMHEYFDSYYVANNMALILSGNFNTRTVMPLIEKSFGRMEPKTLPKADPMIMKPFKGRIVTEIAISPYEMGRLAYHTVPGAHPDQLSIELCSKMLSNGSKTGLLDDLTNSNKIREVRARVQSLAEAGSFSIEFTPLLDQQSLEEAENLVLEKIQALRDGNFSDTLLQSVKTEMIRLNETELEDPRWRIHRIMDLFVYDKDWEKISDFSERVKGITKENIKQIAERYLTENYLAFYSKQGTREKDQCAKPPYKAVKPKNMETQSSYAKLVSEMKISESIPRFIEAGEDFVTGEIVENMRYYYVENPVNNIFSLTFSFHKGKIEDPLLGVAAQAIEYCGTENLSNAEFQKRLQMLGSELNANCGDNYLTIGITGIEDNLVPTIQLLNELFKHPTLEEDKKIIIVNNLKAYDQKDKEHLFTQTRALIEYVLHGDQSFYLQEPTGDELEKQGPVELTKSLLKGIRRQVDIHYVGTIGVPRLVQVLENNFNYTLQYESHENIEEKPMKEFSEDMVYYMNDVNARQSMIGMILISDKNDKEDDLYCDFFNNYFCSGMSSILFQEIRELRSLAYSVGGYYDMPVNRSGGSRFYITMSTQADKTMEALEVLKGLTRDMPQRPERIEGIKNGMKESLNSRFPSFRDLSKDVPNWELKGYTEDPNKSFYPLIDDLTFADVEYFHNKYLKDNRIVFILVGDANQINMEHLRSIGKVVEVNQEEIF